MKSWKEFFRFGRVGVAGFAVDASILAVTLTANAGVLWGRAVSYVAAASRTWALNRHWTFHDRSGRRARQWAQFLALNSCGGASGAPVIDRGRPRAKRRDRLPPAMCHLGERSAHLAATWPGFPYPEAQKPQDIENRGSR